MDRELEHDVRFDLVVASLHPSVRGALLNFVVAAATIRAFPDVIVTVTITKFASVATIAKRQFCI